MAKKSQLRQTRAGTIINVTSRKQESDVYQALHVVIANLSDKYRLRLHHDPYWYLKYIVENLRKNYPEEDFSYYFETSSIRPDGGILSLLDNNGNKYPKCPIRNRLNYLS